MVLESALELYKLDNGDYPSQEIGIDILANEQKKYINGIPNDPWGIPYRYRYPGKFRNFDIWTLGADNSEGGLDENSDIDYVFGNYDIVSNYGDTQGQYVDVKPYLHQLKTGMILGPFFMFRKSLLQKIGVFDEQFLCCNDYDFAMRLTRHGEGKFIPNILGYYLNEGLGQSTKSDSKQPVERTVIELRYGFNILEPHLVPKTREYDVENIIIDDKKIPVSNYVKL